MKIEFDKIPLKVIPNFNGGEKEFETRMYIDDMNKIFKGKLKPGCSIGLHTHNTSSEIIYVLSGKGKVVNLDVTERVGPGDCHYCKKVKVIHLLMMEMKILSFSPLFAINRCLN